MDFIHKKQFKFNGTNHNINLEADVVRDSYADAIKRRAEAEKLKREILNRPFDPSHMEVDLPDSNPQQNNILDPDFMTFE